MLSALFMTASPSIIALIFLDSSVQSKSITAIESLALIAAENWKISYTPREMNSLLSCSL